MAHQIMLILYLVCFSSATAFFSVAFYSLLKSSIDFTSCASTPKYQELPSSCAELCNGFDDRGSKLFHSWSDEELLERAISTEMKRIHAMETDKKRKANRSVAFSFSPESDSSASSTSLSPQLAPNSACQKSYSLVASGGKPKVAFMFLTRGKLAFLPLWNRFFHGHEDLYNIYVHLDPFRVGVFDRNNSGVFWGRLIPPGITERGAPSLAAAMRRLLANALLDDPFNQYFAVISDSCIPLRSFATVYDRLIASDKSFIEILREGPTLPSRYASRGGAAVMLPEVPFSNFRVGSQFFILTRNHTLSIVSDSMIWSKFSTPCSYKNDCFVEEHYFPTLIDMTDGNCATRFTVTNVDWSVIAKNGHPRTYQEQQITQELISSLRRNGTFLFGRKFAGTCLKPLLKLTPFLFEE
ncbi:hypothetical protein KP509_18G049900 [Ceratopteris richardii]|uniref:Core-2/I-branching beta-1,6-N-acetylglucosaminyltransferase family protein n=1 Tax=Ceratopteris richardii TaxID=49495 RepID=A0A8T2SRI1_CERRI|nr:hypothetical protein KP509_18G049900 [Ceratopteris richardii]